MWLIFFYKFIMSNFLDEENKSDETFKFQLGEHVILQIHSGQHVSFKSSIGLQR
jgi:hypothetical protein